MNQRMIPVGGENPYAHHPGFDSQDCSLQLVVTPDPRGSTSSHGFACRGNGAHCIPSMDFCMRMHEREAHFNELEAMFGEAK